MTTSKTMSSTYTREDVLKVVRRIKATLMMIAESTGGWTEDQTADYVHDIGELATAGYLKSIDLSLLDSGTEVRATVFTMNAAAGTMTDQRPGDGLWPIVANPFLRVVLRYNASYTSAARAAMKPKLNVDWQPSTADTSHSGLTASAGLTHASNGYGVERTDWN